MYNSMDQSTRLKVYDEQETERFGENSLKSYFLHKKENKCYFSK